MNVKAIVEKYYKEMLQELSQKELLIASESAIKTILGSVYLAAYYEKEVEVRKEGLKR